MAEIICGGICDIGDCRSSNQDSILCLYGRIEGHEAGLFLVADGMGGLSYGKETSSYIAGQFKLWWENDVPWLIRNTELTDSDIFELLEQEIWDVNQAISDAASRGGYRTGSTLSLLFLLDQRYFIQNLGDSRIYRMRDRQFGLLTVDQTTVQKVISPGGEERYKSVLTMCLGAVEFPKAYRTSGRLQAGDSYLLCSDGLYKYASEEQLPLILGNPQLEAEEAAALLRGSIRAGEARDNVSAVVVRYREAEQR